MGWGPIGAVAGFVSDRVEDVSDWAGDRWEDVSGWVGDHWREIATVVVATVVFAAVTAATGGLGAPALLAVAAGGFASGGAGYVTGQLLNGQPISPRDLLIQATIGGVVSTATFGAGRALTPALGRIATPTILQALPATGRTALTNTAAGAVFGGGARVVENAVRGEALTDGLGTATTLGALNGAISAPLTHAVAAPIEARLTPELPAPSPPPRPSPTRGLIGALDGEAPVAGTAVELAAMAPEPPAVAPRPALPLTRTVADVNGEPYTYRTPPPVEPGAEIRIPLAELRSRQNYVVEGRGAYSETDIFPGPSGGRRVPEVYWVDWATDAAGRPVPGFWAIHEGNHRAFDAAIQGVEAPLVRVVDFVPPESLRTTSTIADSVPSSERVGAYHPVVNTHVHDWNGVSTTVADHMPAAARPGPR